MSKPIRYDLKKAGIKRARVGNDEIFAITIRETDGRDEEVAANYAKSKGGSATAAEEMIRLSIVAVNDKAVQQPYLKFDVWNQRARSFMLKAFNDVNGLSNKEGEDFLATAEEVDDPPPSVPGEASASG